MDINKVPFQSLGTTNKKQPSNVNSPLKSNNPSDRFEASDKKKKNKIVKYSLIGFCVLASSIIIAKHKQIPKLFSKTPKNKTKFHSTTTETQKINGPKSISSTSKAEMDSTQLAETVKAQNSSAVSNNQINVIDSKNTLNSQIPVEQHSTKIDIQPITETTSPDKPEIVATVNTNQNTAETALYIKADTTKPTRKTNKPKIANFTNKTISNAEIRNLIKAHLDNDNRYILSENEKNAIQSKYGQDSKEFIKNLCHPVNDDTIKLMTELINICNGKHAKYWKSNPDKLILIANGGTLKNKINKNWDELTWDIVINSFKTFFDEKKTNYQTLKAIIEYKQCLFEKINCTLTNQNKISKVLKLIERKESLNNKEVNETNLTLQYLKDLTCYQMPGDTMEGQFSESFNNIIKHFDGTKLKSNDLNKIKTKLTNLQSDILNHTESNNAHMKANFIANLIEKHGKNLDGISLTRVERSVFGSGLNTIEIDGTCLSTLMETAKKNNDNHLTQKICDHLTQKQPTIEVGSFISTSLPGFEAFGERKPLIWTLSSDKGIKGLYLEDLYNIFYHKESKLGAEAEVLVQHNAKIQIKKAAFKNGIWELEGRITPTSN